MSDGQSAVSKGLKNTPRPAHRLDRAISLQMSVYSVLSETP